MEFRFSSPEWIKWILFIPLLLFVFWYYQFKWTQKAKAFFKDPRVFVFVTEQISIKKRYFKWILQGLVLSLFLIALARPQLGSSVQKISSEGFELIFAVDVSESMLAEDVKPSRLEQAKKLLEKFIDQNLGNKMGLIAFAGSAAILSPITNDSSAIKLYLDSLTTQTVSEQGTCFECALKLAKEAFDRGGVTKTEDVKVTRVILIASDGEDHEPGALTQAEELTKEGIYIFSLAFGTEKGGAIPIKDTMGYLKGYKKDQKGDTILTTVKGEALEKIAGAGKGKFYFATLDGSEIKNLSEDFNLLEKTQFESLLTTTYDEKFQWPLFIALVLACIELILSDKKNPKKLYNPHRWKGRFQILILAMIILSGCDVVPPPQLFLMHNRALESLKKENFKDARSELLETLAYDPLRSEIHTNLGIAFQLTQEPEQALSSFKKAEELATRPQLKFIDRYNQGQLLGRLDKIDDALEAYQRALELNPESRETKINIELLMQRMEQQNKQKGDGKSDPQNKDNKDQDKSDQKGDDKNQNENDPKKDGGQKQDEKKNQEQERAQSPKYKPREFKGELTPGDVKNILDEFKRQEQKIRSQMYRSEGKTRPKDKDW